MAVRTNVVVAAAVLVLGGLSACATEEPPAETGTTASPTQEAPTDTSPPDGTSESSPTDGTGEDPAGCAPNDDVVPPEAVTGPSADLDGDGQPDELWIADVDGDRVLGVQTASGAVLATSFDSAAPQAASARGQVLGDGSAIVLLDTGRAVPLYAVVDCDLVPTQNDQGEQYTFDRGFTGHGTGVGCLEVDGGGLGLVGYLAEVVGDSATVTTTTIELADGGARASNGESETETGLSPDDELVEIASSVSCGDAEPVQEPQN